MIGVAIQNIEAQIPAASDVFEGATSQKEVDARVGDFVAFLEDHGCAIEKRGVITYDPRLRAAEWISGWSVRRVRDDPRRFAFLGWKPWLSR